jgi:putative Mg2+ transporter-C (MgtC) family protein
MATGTTEGSVTRIAAQIVTGVGFLGAGAIIQDRGGVHGLTSAATIWLVASVGMACGARFFQLAVVSTCIAIFALLVLRKLEKPLDRYRIKKSSQNIPSEKDQPNQSL